MEQSKNKYNREIASRNGLSDVYDVLEAFDVICPARQHAIKKLLCAGIRGKGDVIQDLTEAAQAVERALQLQNDRSG